MEGAHDLWKRNPYHFQKWAVEQVDGFVTTKQTSDGGIRALETRIAEVDRQLQDLASADPVSVRLQTVPGVGKLTATALVGSVGHIHAFGRGRQFASWLGLTPREYSSGGRRRLGRISKRGDRYLRVPC